MENSARSPLLLQVQDLKKYYEIKGQKLFSKSEFVKAVDGVSFDLHVGETIGLVGESGCGKSTLAQTIMRLNEPTSGKALFKGTDIFSQDRESMRKLRQDIQIIFQDPYDSLNPRMTVRQIVSEPWKIFPNLLTKEQWNDRLDELLIRVGLHPEDSNRFPHQFSGGQRQRIGIARALAVDPEMIVCDEPVSALDVSVQAQVVNLLDEIQEEFGLSYLFIAHNLSVIRHISSRVIVMYLGKIVESGPIDVVYDSPAHPYTQALLSAVPKEDPRARGKDSNVIKLEGDVPSPIHPPSGCSFHTRCRKAQPECSEITPELQKFNHPERLCACLFPEELDVLSL